MSQPPGARLRGYRFPLGLLGLLVCGPLLCGQEQTQFWPEAEMYLNLSSRARQVFVTELNADPRTGNLQGEFGPSMVKVAMQSTMHCAHDPGAVLSGLNAVLSGQTHAQFISAAYLWLDTESRRTQYSSAGHPPLLRLRNDKLERILSNGTLLGSCRKPRSQF